MMLYDMYFRSLIVLILIARFMYLQMKDNTYRSLSQVNTVFVKYNLLVGVENLGLADCNKYYVSLMIVQQVYATICRISICTHWFVEKILCIKREFIYIWGGEV